MLRWRDGLPVKIISAIDGSVNESAIQVEWIWVYSNWRLYPVIVRPCIAPWFDHINRAHSTCAPRSRVTYGVDCLDWILLNKDVITD